MRGLRKNRQREGSGFLGKVLSILVLGVGVGFGAIVFLGVKGEKLNFGRVNIAVSGEQTVVFSINSRDREVTAVVIPNDVFLTEVAHGYGRFQVGKVYQAGEVDKRGGVVFKDTLQEYLGIAVDRYIKVAGKPAAEPKEFFLSLNYLFPKETDLTLFERLKTAYTVSRVRFDRVETVELEGVLEPVLLPDGSTARTLEKDKLDQILRGKFTETPIRNENLRVEVINSTTYSGLGNRAARILENSGVTVVNVGTVPLALEKCQLQVELKNRESETIKRINSIFNCRIEKLVINARAEAVLILGQDYVDKLTR